MQKDLIQFGETHKVQGMTSLQIAEVTGKRHADVMRDIRNILGQGVNERNFALVEYRDKKGESRPMYELTPKGCLILASGYDVVLREKIIDKLEEYQQ
jgi:Rha family phage regulatory protein